jgi:hypothetical protein
MSLVSLAQVLDRSFPPCTESTTKQTKTKSGGLRDVSNENRLMKRSPEVLKSLIRDDEMYDVALVVLDHLLAANLHLMIPEPPSQSVFLSRLRPVVLEKDTEVNFTTAVHDRVSDVLQQLYPNRFRSQSGDGRKDITDSIWVNEGTCAMNMEFKTRFVTARTKSRQPKVIFKTTQLCL